MSKRVARTMSAADTPQDKADVPDAGWTEKRGEREALRAGEGAEGPPWAAALEWMVPPPSAPPAPTAHHPGIPPALSLLCWGVSSTLGKPSRGAAQGRETRSPAKRAHIQEEPRFPSPQPRPHPCMGCLCHLDPCPRVPHTRTACPQASQQTAELPGRGSQVLSAPRPLPPHLRSPSDKDLHHLKGDGAPPSPQPHHLPTLPAQQAHPPLPITGCAGEMLQPLPAVKSAKHENLVLTYRQHLRDGTLHKLSMECPSWLSGNEPNEGPGGCRFDPWPRSVG